MLTRNTPGNEPDIVVDGDTSGFLAATKLANAVVDPGAVVIVALDAASADVAVATTLALDNLALRANRAWVKLREIGEQVDPIVLSDIARISEPA